MTVVRSRGRRFGLAVAASYALLLVTSFVVRGSRRPAFRVDPVEHTAELRAIDHAKQRTSIIGSFHRVS